MTGDTIGERIRAARESRVWVDEFGQVRRGWTQEQLAKALHVSQPLVSHWEHGRHPVTAAHQRRLAEALDVDTRDLFAPLGEAA